MGRTGRQVGHQSPPYHTQGKVHDWSSHSTLSSPMSGKFWSKRADRSQRKPRRESESHSRVSIQPVVSGGRGYTCLPTPLSGPRWASRTSCTCWGERQQGKEAILHLAVTEGAPSRAYHHQCTSCELSSCVFVLLALLSCHLSQGDRGQKGVRGPPGVIGRPVSGGADDGCL